LASYYQRLATCGKTREDWSDGVLEWWSDGF
jgi:hypothetical protein